MKPHEIISYPLMTESTTRLIEDENKLIFIVNMKANKRDIKRSIEELYEVKVSKVNVLITSRGIKKAIIKIHPEYKAVDIAIKLGIL